MNRNQAFTIADWLVQLEFRLEKWELSEKSQLYIHKREMIIERLLSKQ